MKMRFSIGRRIGTGFGVVIFFIVIIFLINVRNIQSGIEVLEKTKNLNEQISSIETPSLNLIIDLSNTIRESKTLITRWASEQTREDDPDKLALVELTDKRYLKLKRDLESFFSHWPEKEVEIMQRVFSDINTLFDLHDEVKNSLVTFKDYEDPELVFMARFLVETDGDIDVQTNKVLFGLDDLRKRQELRLAKSRKNQTEASEETMRSFKFLFSLVVLAGIALVVGSILIAAFTTRSIVKPIQSLKYSLQLMGRGVIPTEKLEPTNDEVGDMSLALNSLIDGFKRTSEFSRQVGQGNFNYNYQPLSNDDVLGHALLKMRDDLAENERILEQKVIERTEEVVRQKEEIEKQRQKLEELYKDVTDSIRYAKRLQDSILPPEVLVRKILPDSFVLFKPKDIVSGDFYWFFERDNKVLFAAVDCTGHGVPGAFMSIVGANALNQAVREHGITDPGEILNDVNRLSSEIFNKNLETTSVRDGMDLALCVLDKETNTLQFAGANNPLYLIRDGELHQIKSDKLAIGSFEPGRYMYTRQDLKLQKGDQLYVFSDGYADQFGGPKGKKYMYRQFRETLMSIKTLSMTEQKIKLIEAMEKWKGSFEQVDDILVIGVKI